MAQWLEKFTDNLKDILDYPPYLIFVFVGSVLMMVSLATKDFYEQMWIFLLYSFGGALWRYIEKDLNSGIKKILKEKRAKNISHLIIIIVYHTGNIGLFFVLLHYLKLI